MPERAFDLAIAHLDKQAAKRTGMAVDIADDVVAMCGSGFNLDIAAAADPSIVIGHARHDPGSRGSHDRAPDHPAGSPRAPPLSMRISRPGLEPCTQPPELCIRR